jgi:hypothetical protein
MTITFTSYELFRAAISALFGFVLSIGGITPRRWHFWVLVAILFVYALPENA